MFSTLFRTHLFPSQIVDSWGTGRSLTEGEPYCPNVGTCCRSGRGSSTFATGLFANDLDVRSAPGPVAVMPADRSLEVPFRLRRL